MEIKVRLFALARQLANCDTLTVAMSQQATVKDLRHEIAHKCPQLAGLMSQMLIAVDSEYAGDATPVSERSDVACIPPVSGG